MQKIVETLGVLFLGMVIGFTVGYLVVEEMYASAYDRFCEEYHETSIWR